MDTVLHWFQCVPSGIYLAAGFILSLCWSMVHLDYCEWDDKTNGVKRTNGQLMIGNIVPFMVMVMWPVAFATFTVSMHPFWHQVQTAWIYLIVLALIIAASILLAVILKVLWKTGRAVFRWVQRFAVSHPAKRFTVWWNTPSSW